MKNNKSNYYLLLPYLRPQLTTLLQALSCTLIFTIFWPVLAWLAGRMAKYIGAGDLGAIAQLAGVAAIVFLVRGIVQYGQDSLMAKAALKIARDLRIRVYSHLQTLSLSYFAVSKTGDLAYRLTEDIDRIGEVINKVFHQFVPCILQLVVVVGYMFFLNWQLTLGVIIVAPLMALLITVFGSQLLKFSRRSQARISNLSALLTEVFSGMRLIQAFNAQEYEIERFVEEAEQNRRIKLLTEKLKAFQFVVVGFLEAMSIVFLFFLGGWQIAKGNLIGSEFVSYVAAVALLIDPITITTSNYNDFKQGEASVDRIFELFAIQPEILEKPGAIALNSVKGKVEYHSVSFAYDNFKSVLTDLSFTAQPGEMIALVGSSGAGKTTLINLLLRFNSPNGGKILVDDIDIAQVTLNSLRAQMAVVPQETILFSGTIAENIAFGQTQFDLIEVEQAAKIANAHEFINQLPAGYQAYLGERGVNLSGGQRQRIAIARAIFRDPSILILDEATSSLDSESESLVQQALERIMENRTVFVIAHRLATVRRADRILVLEKGQVIEAGTHQELLSQQGRYAGFHAQQFS
ncbi:ABC transporter ATP-binding protein [Gloeocapsa sp. PCC 73106]|uniref:ABC transporter ATP-binding protein n=1 Tax=Gloeocapsa sp. PCC 73106 TaxID=102232 RepID=UPI0002ABF010|nr:ABC transporter ATP-binding protein [Gloeocapsa sp. PCC 73106]ELR97315.1 ABC-type multidrug transport system, ATPase and permease component [Gloeocapsa sp. PCC 73106]